MRIPLNIKAGSGSVCVASDAPRDRYGRLCGLPLLWFVRTNRGQFAVAQADLLSCLGGIVARQKCANINNESAKGRCCMKRAFFVMVVVGLFLSSSVFAGDLVNWYSLKDGMEKAKTEKKPVVLDFFYGQGCPRCEFLEKEVYSNPAIAKKIMDDFVPIRIDLKKKLSPEEESLGEKYNFRNDCLLIFLDANGDLVKEGGKKLCFIDRVDPDEFIKYLDEAKARAAK
jgi:thioredoxin-related protein